MSQTPRAFELPKRDNIPHELGSIETSNDLGLGGSALAVRHEVSGGSDLLRIWLGTVSDPAARPGAYGNPTATLQPSEVATGAVHMLTWVPGQGFGAAGAALQTVTFHPTTLQPRGAYGVVGMCLTDLLAGSPGDELIVGTLSGDLIVFNINPATNLLNEIWRTHVDGAIGFYNSIVAEDLNNDGYKELYVAGSAGLWRFRQPQEGPTP